MLGVDHHSGVTSLTTQLPAQGARPECYRTKSVTNVEMSIYLFIVCTVQKII